MCMNIYNEFEVESKNKIYSKLQAALETNKYTITKRKDYINTHTVQQKITTRL